MSSPWIATIGMALVHFVWQGAAIGLVTAAVLWLLRPKSAASRYVVALAGLLLMAATPVATSIMLWKPASSVVVSLTTPDQVVPPAADATSIIAVDIVTPLVEPTEADAAIASDEVLAAGQAVAHEPQDVAAFLRPFLPWVVTLWLAGIVGLSIRLAVGSLRVRSMCRRGTSSPPDRWQEMAESLCEKLRVSRPVRVLQSTIAEVPTVVGWLRPVILLPATALTGFSPDQLRVLLAHEVAHIRRHDYIINLLQTAIETVFFYHPAVWWLSSRIRQEREHCCDDMAVAVCGDETFYAKTLHALAELSAPPQQLAVAARGGQLLPRIQRLVGIRRQTELSVTGWLPGVVVATVLVVAVWTTLAATQTGADDTVTNGTSLTFDTVTDALTSEQSEADEDLTPSLIANRIEEVIERFKSIEYAAEMTTVRDGKLLELQSGKILYRGDGLRWYFEEEDRVPQRGETEPNQDFAGFDGELHFYTEEGRQVTYGEEDGAGYRNRPRQVLWHAGRGPSLLLHVLRREEARIDRREVINGHECLVITTAFGEGKTEGAPEWQYEVTISPVQSYLPIRVSIRYQGEAYADERMSELARANNGDWYPTKLDWIQRTKDAATTNRHTRITSLKLRQDFQPADFRFEPPVGYTVMDRRLGYSWHEDPWWPELRGWFREHYDWPPADESALENMNSFADAQIDGQPAPPIADSEWLNGDPGGWDRPGRKVTVLMFYGGQAIDPTPQWTFAIKRLHERYRDLGLDVVGVASASSDPTLIKSTVKELAIPFPVAIDQPQKGAHGKTSSAYAMRHYASLFVIDSEGLVRFVNADDRAVGGKFSRLEQLVRELLPGASEVAVESKAPRQLQSQPIVKAVRAELRRLRDLADGRGRIHGTIIAPSVADVQIRATPVVRLLSFPNIPTSWLTITADQLATTIAPNADGTFSLDDLPKGSYVVKFSGPGVKPVEHQVILSTHQSTAVLDVRPDANDGAATGTAPDAVAVAATNAQEDVTEGAAATVLAQESATASNVTDTDSEPAAAAPKKDELTVTYPGIVGISEGKQKIIQPIMMNLVESSVYNSAQHPFAFSEYKVIRKRFARTLAAPHLVATLAKPKLIDKGDGKLRIAKVVIGVSKSIVDATFTVDPDGRIVEHDRGRRVHLEHLRDALVWVAKAEDGSALKINSSVRPRATFEIILPIDGDAIPWSMHIARFPSTDMHAFVAGLAENTTIRVDAVKVSHHDLTSKLSVVDVTGSLTKSDLANLVRYVNRQFQVDDFTVRLRGSQDDIVWSDVVETATVPINAGLDVGLQAEWVIELQGYHADQPIKPALLSALARLGDKRKTATPTPESETEDQFSLAAAVRAINVAKAAMPVNHEVPPLKEQAVIDKLKELVQPEGLSDADFAKLKKIVATRRLPRDVTLKQYIRYDAGTYMQHGWFVRLMLERDGASPFNLWIGKHHKKGLPYTQKERQFREEVRKSRGMPTLGRLISYFDADPKFDKPLGFVVDPDELLEQAQKAIRDDKDVDAFLKLFHWEGVDDATREFVRREAEHMVKRQPLIITPEYKFYGGKLVHWQGVRTYEPNLEVVGYIDFDFGGGHAIWMEFGEDKDDDYKLKFINYVVKEDNLEKFLGKELTSPINVSGYNSLLPDGHIEMGWNITAPDELAPLRQANLELWRVPAK
jgi:beta-lactamase regulating signal transducer with metallopeptidase domain